MKILSFFSKFTYNLITWLFIGIVSLILILNVISFFFIGFSLGFSNEIRYFLFLISFSLIAFFVYKKHFYKNIKFWLVIFITGAIAKIIYSIICNVPVTSDCKSCLDAATLLTKGDMSWLNLSYFHRWAYQIPFVYYESAILTIFKATRALYIFNAVWSILTCYLLYKTIEKISENKLIALLLSSLYMWIPSSFLQIGSLYNQIFSGLILILSIYCYVCTIKKSKESKSLNIRFIIFSLITGLFLGLSTLFRQEAIIILLACICYSLYSCFQICNNSNPIIKKDVFSSLINIIISILLLTFGYFIVTNTADFIAISNGITDSGLKNNCPYWFIVCGLTPDNYGQYSTTYSWIVGITNPVEQKEAFGKILSDIFSKMSFTDIITFFAKKQYFMWGAFDPTNTYTFPSLFQHIILVFDKFLYILFTAFALIGAKFNKDKINKEKIFLLISFIGFFFVFMIKETSVKYRYNSIMILMLIAMFGLMKINEKKGLFKNER